MERDDEEEEEEVEREQEGGDDEQEVHVNLNGVHLNVASSGLPAGVPETTFSFLLQRRWRGRWPPLSGATSKVDSQMPCQ